MNTFLIFAFILTIVYVIYYLFMIAHDLYGKPKERKDSAESFDVSDMVDTEENSVDVSENAGGFSVGGTTYETTYAEESPEASGGEQSKTQPKTPVADEIMEKIAGKSEDVPVAFSDVYSAEELNRKIMARGIPEDGRAKLYVQPIKKEV
ncbi:MAG: hypothetical protein LUC22_01975 [Prevotella sp.]|nr:hypothetical protein [Prevotella sp.]